MRGAAFGWTVIGLGFVALLAIVFGFVWLVQRLASVPLPEGDYIEWKPEAHAKIIVGLGLLLLAGAIVL